MAGLERLLEIRRVDVELQLEVDSAGTAGDDWNSTNNADDDVFIGAGSVPATLIESTANPGLTTKPSVQ